MTTDPVNPVKDTEPTIGQLVADASRDVSTLLQKEIELAKAELKVSVRNGGTGAVLFAVAGFLGLLAIILLSIAFAHLIHWNGDGLDLHWAYLIVTGAYLLLAGLLVFLGIRKVKKVRAPERAIRQGKQIPPALKGKVG
ncbi:phage holin family protein [Nocardioides sp. ChNu-153]|uniref:phage holin family protein n=1 Tax=unclassified Nocardioides TaxID=2615069 RepID=UPI00240649C1|nr:MULTISPECIES: phage holin family protein [unclassified Nocardioides]MDF9715771.1 phage holin family protein [Nocardioides sp. ChNu-99]MDN7121876.1 phage holin family protein [Nocardioides sp. ChNu-153]